MPKLVQEINYLNGGLEEATNKHKPCSRSELGLLHSALDLNTNLGREGQGQDILKTMHNTALRIVSFIDEALKLQPTVTEEYSQDSAKDFEFERIISEDCKSYSIKHKSGLDISVHANQKDPKVSAGYEIQFADSGLSRQTIDANAVQEVRSIDERTRFDIEFSEEANITLTSHQANVIDQDRPAAGSDPFLANFQVALDADKKSTEEHNLSELNLNKDTDSIKRLTEALSLETS